MSSFYRFTTSPCLANAMLLLSAILLCAPASDAQATDPRAAAPACGNEIPTGVKVIRVPEPDQRKVTLSDFSVSANKGALTYDLAMQVKNGTDSWCITSLAVTYLLGDARGQEWTANEYPAVMDFKMPSDAPKSGTARKSIPALEPVPHSVGMAPGRDEKRVVLDLYNYIQPRPTGFFDGFHLISAEIKYCMGYPLTRGN